MSGASRYAIRNQALREMGYANYQAYLDSPLWLTIRMRIMARDTGWCRCCKRRAAISVHHITYDKPVMLGNDDTQLIAICAGCHKRAEFNGEKKLTSTTEIFRRTRAGKRAVKKDMRPRCRCCKEQRKRLGRNDICMGCYKSGRALRFVQEHGIPKG